MAVSSGLHSGSTDSTRLFSVHIITVILREQRTHGTIDNTCCSEPRSQKPSLSLIETARNLSHRVHFFLIFHTQREEINSISGLVRGSSR